MIKKTLYFGHATYLSLKDQQLVIRSPDLEAGEESEEKKKETIRTIPIEDIGLMVLDSSRLTLTQNLLTALLANNTAVVICDLKRMPTGLVMPLESNLLQSERFRDQIDATEPLKKQLWQQTMQAKIMNQAAVLHQKTGDPIKNMEVMAKNVKSGDPENKEGQAAVYYWSHLFPEIPQFDRGREGCAPNQALNYGYAILRAIVARSLVGSGLLPTLGIHHRNRYNAYCLADDIMEPYRAYVDQCVIEMMRERVLTEELTPADKIDLLGIPVREVIIDGKRSPLEIAVAQTTASLNKCYEGEIRKISYPTID